MASPKKSALFRLRWLLLVPIPLVWCLLAHYGKLDFLENKSVDWRFRYRGPISAPVKVVYVDVDSFSLGQTEIGGWPWSRGYFARVARTLLDKGGARAVGMDFVFSDLGEAESIDKTKLIDGNRALGSFLLKTDAAVVGASYSAAEFRDFDKKAVRNLPLVARGLPPADKLYPRNCRHSTSGEARPSVRPASH